MNQRPDEPRDLLDSEAYPVPDDPSAGMGVSSERVGPVRGSTEPKAYGTEATGVAAEEDAESFTDPGPGKD